MPEYLSPGVDVEEFGWGSVPMQGVSTSAAGFLGMAERGKVAGEPILLTHFSEFLRNFGGYLSENEYGEYRYLAYGVEHFFVNGGSRCFVMRVAPEDAKCSTNTKKDEVIKFTAGNPGMWGDKVRLTIYPSSKAKTQIYEKTGEKSYVVKTSAGFNPGDVVVFTDGNEKIVNKVLTSQDNIIEFERPFEADVVDKNLLPKKFIETSEITVEVKYDDVKEVYEKVSFNQSASNFIEKRMVKSELVHVKYAGGFITKTAGGDSEEGSENHNKSSGLITPYAMLGDEGVEFITITLENGSNGDVSKITAADFLGSDLGPGKRTGLQAFTDNDQVSIMAVPGIVDPNVQLSLVAHCENLSNRFAILDIPRESKKVPDVLAHRDMFDSQYAAMYHPWLQVFDPLDKRNISIPPSGSMAGCFFTDGLGKRCT
jgi:uncharacterized protein